MYSFDLSRAVCWAIMMICLMPFWYFKAALLWGLIFDNSDACDRAGKIVAILLAAFTGFVIVVLRLP